MRRLAAGAASTSRRAQQGASLILNDHRGYSVDRSHQTSHQTTASACTRQSPCPDQQCGLEDQQHLPAGRRTRSHLRFERAEHEPTSGSRSRSRRASGSPMPLSLCDQTSRDVNPLAATQRDRSRTDAAARAACRPGGPRCSAHPCRTQGKQHAGDEALQGDVVRQRVHPACTRKVSQDSSPTSKPRSRKDAICRHFRQWSQPGSNRRPPACKAGALPTELWPRAGESSRAPERA